MRRAGPRRRAVDVDPATLAGAQGNGVTDQHLVVAGGERGIPRSIGRMTGDDVGGAKELSNAISLTPTRAFAGEATSPLFTATCKKLREKG